MKEKKRKKDKNQEKIDKNLAKLIKKDDGTYKKVQKFGGALKGAKMVDQQAKRQNDEINKKKINQDEEQVNNQNST